MNTLEKIFLSMYLILLFVTFSNSMNMRNSDKVKNYFGISKNHNLSNQEKKLTKDKLSDSMHGSSSSSYAKMTQREVFNNFILLN